MRKNAWSEEEKEFLINNYANMDNKEIAKELKKSTKVIATKASAMRLLKPEALKIKWTKEQERFLTNNYINMSLREISKIINKSVKAVADKAYELNLRKPSISYEHKHKKEGHQQPCWECVHAVPNKNGNPNIGCEWSRYLKPVEGWVAEYVNTYYGGFYKIKHCPKFVKENRRA